MKKIATFVLLGFVGILLSLSNGVQVQATDSVSIDYMKKMGFGWNLGNTFDGFDKDKKLYEESWGNPRVTKTLIQSIKAQGFTSIRLPFSVIDRQDEANVIDSEFLKRYTEIVTLAQEEGLYVMVNIHHDSWEWLKYWDGSDDSKEYKRFVSLWEQLATHFKDESSLVSFESINEPQFEGIEENQKLAKLNQIFYHIVRNSGGNNATRMLIIPTLLTKTDQAELDITLAEIINYQDPNILATVHYYSEWVFSNNMGITNIDEQLFDNSDSTARTSIVDLYTKLNNTFLDKGIGVVIGEYGLLGYDRGDDVNDVGELVKYVSFMSEKSQETGISLMLWDNGQHFDRLNLQWKVPYLGQAIQKSMHGKSSYGKNHDKSYVTETTKELVIPLEMNGNTLETITDILNNRTLIPNVDYEYSQNSVRLTENYINTLNKDTYGLKSQLEFLFNQGANWKQDVYWATQLNIGDSSGEIGKALTIPIEYNGESLRRAQLKNEIGEIISTNSWWKYLTYRDEFIPDYPNNELVIPEKMTSLLTTGTYILTLETFQGTIREYHLTINDSKQITGTITSNPTEPSDSSGSDSSSSSTSDDSSSSDSSSASDSDSSNDSDNSSSSDSNNSNSSGSSDTSVSNSSSYRSSNSSSRGSNQEEKNLLPKTGSETNNLIIILGVLFCLGSLALSFIIKENK